MPIEHLRLRAIAQPLLTLVAIPLAATAVAAEPSGKWLDRGGNWNQPGASLPLAPTQAENNLDYCRNAERPASLPEDQLLVVAGWTLTGAAQIFGATTVITAMTDADGMCRPLNYQVFVFNDGKFSGTLSPILMDSRTDGSLADLRLSGEGAIYATFNRYDPDDALCCASRESFLFYQMDSSNTLIPQFPADTSARQQ